MTSPTSSHKLPVSKYLLRAPRGNATRLVTPPSPRHQQHHKDHKDINDLQRARHLLQPPAATPHDPTFARGLGLFDSVMVVVGVMIGSGIFIVSADMSRQIGSAGWLLVAWLFTGVLTIAGALSYGELAAMMPRAGGMYIYLREAFSPLWGFLYGWTLCTVIQTGTIAAVAIAFARFSGVLFPSDFGSLTI